VLPQIRVFYFILFYFIYLGLYIECTCSNEENYDVNLKFSSYSLIEQLVTARSPVLS
jgi:hypothetical protein